MLAKMIAGAAASALALTPVAASAASANSASSLSVAKSVRASAPTTGANKAAGGAGSIGVYVVGAALLVGFGFLIADNVDNDDSDSN